MLQMKDIPEVQRPIFNNHGEGVWTVGYNFHTVAESLALFCAAHRELRITAMVLESRTPIFGIITLKTEIKKKYPDYA